MLNKNKVPTRNYEIALFDRKSVVTFMRYKKKMNNYIDVRIKSITIL